ncbi:MAG: hypothetical protein JXX28_05500, partial [Deltaproteobacteria bacterium]|nr:hypothetical protein [Deltaproteobacteria bacterium]
SPWYADADGDGFGAGAQVLACGAPAGHVSTPGDCDDAHGAVNPDATEVCDGLDNDCDGIIDLDTASPPTWYRDADQDGFGDEAFPIQACDAPLGYRGAAGDCDDLDPEIRPDSPPGCDDRDHNCDGEIDHDADGDGFSDGYCGGSDWDDADPTCAADCADGLSVHSPAESCQDLFTRSPEGADGLYWVDPLSSGEPLQVWCHLSAGGWTLIASQPALWPDDMALHLDEVVPEPSVQGALGLYFQTDLRELGNELWVVNDRGEEAVFLLDDFTGPLVFDAPNWVDAADTSWSGIIAGSAYPVITHFQVGQACTAADCHKAIGSSSSYTNGLAVILDWHNGDTTTSLSSHAHFGGTATIERGWASRGVALYLR